MATVLAVPCAAGALPRESARGHGASEFVLNAVGRASFSFTARGGPRPTGYVRTKGDPDGAGPIPPFTAEGPITCLRVDGRRASLKWRFRRATGSAASFRGGGIQTYVQDDGRPRRGQSVDHGALDPPQPAAAFDPLARTCEFMLKEEAHHM
ncbi:MAG TPA: hypothetical protein VJT75_01285, partial [Thermoleophilaceae bacterium]|nr:hypothetical protein [Thermoleophilaceae bacterium]